MPRGQAGAASAAAEGTAAGGGTDPLGARARPPGGSPAPMPPRMAANPIAEPATTTASTPAVAIVRVLRAPRSPEVDGFWIAEGGTAADGTASEAGPEGGASAVISRPRGSDDAADGAVGTRSEATDARGFP